MQGLSIITFHQHLAYSETALKHCQYIADLLTEQFPTIWRHKMISLLGSLLGFGSSLIGPVLDAWNRSADQKHELAMLHAQAEVQSKLQDQRLEATIVEADMAEIVAAHKEQAATVRKGLVCLAALSGSVRPVVTYLIIVEYLAIN